MVIGILASACSDSLPVQNSSEISTPDDNRNNSPTSAVESAKSISSSEDVSLQREHAAFVEEMTKKYSKQLSYIWLSNEPPYRLHIAATTHEALAYAKGINSEVETHLVKYSYDEMQSIHQRLTDLLYGGFDPDRKCFAAFKPEEMKIYLGLIDLTEDQKRSAAYRDIQEMVETYPDLIELSHDTTTYGLASEEY